MRKNSFFICSCLFLFSCDPTRERELRSFLDINRSLEGVVENLNNSNIYSEKTIHRLIMERGNKRQDDSIGAIADKLRKESASLLTKIDSIKENLIEQTGGINENGPVKGFSSKIDVKSIRSLSDSIISFFSLHPLSRNDSIKIYLNSLSEKLPLSIQLMNLSCLQWKISKLENDVMIDWRAYLLSQEFVKFDHIKICVVSPSTIVEDGQPYKARVYVTGMGNRKMIGDIKFRNKSIPIDSNGIGMVKFVARGDKFDEEGLCKRSWNGSITLKIGSGRDSVYSFIREYKVRKKCNH
jgi:hypothetical protein